MGNTNSGVSYMKSVNTGLQLSGFVSHGTGVKISTDDDRHRLGYVFKRGGGWPVEQPFNLWFLRLVLSSSLYICLKGLRRVSGTSGRSDGCRGVRLFKHKGVKLTKTRSR